MTPTSRVGTLLAGVVFLVAACCDVAATPAATYEAPTLSFTPVVLPTPSSEPSASLRAPETPMEAEKPGLPTPPPPTKRPAPVSAIGSAQIGGKATWYCCTRGYGRNDMVAAAGPELRIGQWRGKAVTVTGPGGNSITVRLVDWCACPGGRVIDLSPGAFARLAPLSRGVIRVAVTLPD